MISKHTSLNSKVHNNTLKTGSLFFLCSFPLSNIAYKMYKLQIDYMLILTVFNTFIDDSYNLVY